MLLGCYFFLPAGDAKAADTVDDLSAVVKVGPEGMLEITERIVYDFGNARGQGIERIIPYSYEFAGRDINLRLFDFNVANPVGDPFVFSVDDRDGAMVISIGGPDGYVTGSIEYVIEYKADGAVIFGDGSDRIIWQVTGYDLPVPARQTRLDMVLPRPAPDEAVDTGCVAGGPGKSGGCVSTRYRYNKEGGVTTIVFTDDYLEPGNGVAVTVDLPKGLIAEPPFWRELITMLKSYLLYIALLFILAGLLIIRRKKVIRHKT